MAFLFRTFAVEAFVIPTGSMAPTLRGAHLVGVGPESGYRFAVGPRDMAQGTTLALPIQGSTGAGPIEVADPMLSTNTARQPDEINVRFQGARTRMGDRILVLKYLYSFFPPRRFDVIVFKNPTDPRQNYIKRLIGLPNETVWLADGDVFVSKQDGEIGSFTIERKPEHVQRRVWQPVYHSQYIPVHPDHITPRWSPPWDGGPNWEIDRKRSYQCTTDQPATLVYRNDLKPIEDRYVYNESGRGKTTFPVSDIRLTGIVQAEDDAWSSTIRLRCRQHVFEAVVSNGRAVLRMAADGHGDAAPDWQVLADEAVDINDKPGAFTPIEFWHADQALWLWVNDDLVAKAEYDWSANMRLDLATGLAGSEAAALVQRQTERSAQLHNPYSYGPAKPSQPHIEWEFAGGPLTLHRIELDRDLFYRPDEMPRPSLTDTVYPALATHPIHLPTLNGDQFFACGDNSPNSLDGRLWGDPVPWIDFLFDDAAPGVVPRELLLGKAFFVYFPSPESLSENGRRFIPNFGEMRFIH
ncbi:MAG: signal peptidase I [Planctomycetes bacterium]|nr:signal peptidase I [Planctomycetota bacterium]